MLYATNEQLDEAMRQAIREGNTQFSAIKVEAKLKLADQGLQPPDHTAYFRLADRSLQRLRKAGVIHYRGGKLGWAIKQHEEEAE